MYEMVTFHVCIKIQKYVHAIVIIIIVVVSMLLHYYAVINHI